MFYKKCNKRRCCNHQNKTFGIILTAVGFGLFLAYIIPYYLLITMLGLVFIVAGLGCLIKK